MRRTSPRVKRFRLESRYGLQAQTLRTPGFETAPNQRKIRPCISHWFCKDFHHSCLTVFIDILCFAMDDVLRFVLQWFRSLLVFILHFLLLGYFPSWATPYQFFNKCIWFGFPASVKLGSNLSRQPPLVCLRRQIPVFSRSARGSAQRALSRRVTLALNASGSSLATVCDRKRYAHQGLRTFQTKGKSDHAFLIVFVMVFHHSCLMFFYIFSVLGWVSFWGLFYNGFGTLWFSSCMF